MEKVYQHPRSHLFTVRVWEEEVASGQTEWRGKAQLMTSGEVRYFRHLAALVPLLVTMLSELEPWPEATQETRSGEEYEGAQTHEERS
jgi:hypothetical protein